LPDLKPGDEGYVAPETPLTPADVNILEIMTENERLKKDLSEAIEALVDYKTNLTRANDTIDYQNRARLIHDLNNMGCTYGLEALGRMTTDELRGLIQHYNHIKKPAFKSSADVGGQTPPQESLYSLYGQGWKPKVT